MVKDGDILNPICPRLKMIIGNYLGIISEARRVGLPKKFLAELGETPIIAKWYEDCLVIVKNDYLQSLIVKLTGGEGVKDLGFREIDRFILGSSFELEPDEQGRIIVPESLARYAGIEKEIVFVGLLDRVEIWKKEVWDEKSRVLSKTTKEYIENLSKNVKTKH